jgi:integrase
LFTVALFALLRIASVCFRFASGNREMATLTKRAVDAAKPKAGEYFIWCTSSPGFGLRVYPSGRKIFICQVRVGRTTRRIKIGAYGAFTVDQARRHASDIARAAAEGRDPQREKSEARSAITVCQLCDEYLNAAHVGLVLTRFGRAKSLSTVAIDEGRIARHIKPLLGSRRARDVTRADVQRMADKITQGGTAGVFKGKSRGKAVVTGGPGSAARVVGLLGGMFSWAEKRGLVHGPNPTKGTEIVRSGAKDRVLSHSELFALGQAAKAAEAKSPAAADAVRLIALTGMRREEACGLRWSEVDAGAHCVRLEHTKTGRSMRPIGSAAIAILNDRRRVKDSDTWVFPNRNNTGSADLKNSIATIFDAAGLKDARAQELRRTFASIAAAEEYSDSTIAELLGHARRGVTSRHYIRRPDAALVAAADRVSAVIASALSRPTKDAEILIFREATN